MAYATANGLSIIKTVSEIGSGVNGHRPKRVRLLCDPKVVMRVVEHRDRLARCGAESIEAALAAHGRRLVVVDSTEMKGRSGGSSGRCPKAAVKLPSMTQEPNTDISHGIFG